MAEWGNIHAMFDDVARFAREHPQHLFLWADRPPFYGIVAFIEGAEDEQAEEWTIPLSAVQLTSKRHANAELMVRAFQTSEGKRRLLEALVSRARNQPPIVRRSRYELLMQDDD